MSEDVATWIILLSVIVIFIGFPVMLHLIPDRWFDWLRPPVPVVKSNFVIVAIHDNEVTLWTDDLPSLEEACQVAKVLDELYRIEGITFDGHDITKKPFAFPCSFEYYFTCLEYQGILARWKAHLPPPGQPEWIRK